MVVGRGKGGLLQQRAALPRAFGKEKRARFLDALAATCNVEFAAAQAGVDQTTPRRARRRDGTFARLWAEAIEQGQERLREELVACALGQIAGGDNPGDERDPVATAPFDPALAIKVLSIQARVGAGGRPSSKGAAPTAREIYAALARRLDEAEARLARRGMSAPTAGDMSEAK